MLVSVLYSRFYSVASLHLDSARGRTGGYSIIDRTKFLFRCTLLLASAAMNLFNLVTCKLALLAWSSIPLGYSDLLSLNLSTLALSQISILLLSMISSWVFLLETGITANLFMLVLIFHSLSYWFCFSTSLWVLRLSVLLHSPVLLALSVVIICVTSSANISVRLFGSGSGVSLVYRE